MTERQLQLNAWQQKAYRIIMNDIQKKFGNTSDSKTIYGTFIPGPPGAGKTTLVNYVVEQIQKEYPDLIIDVTATTGAAATRLKNAKTLSTWLQIGSQSLKLDKYDHIWAEIKKRQPDRIKLCNILILDEVSMLSQRSWENLNRICQNLRKNPCDFGGIYIIALGDPLQLPPVPHDSGPGLLRNTQEFVASCLEREYPGYNYVVANQMMRAEDKDFMRCLLKLVSSNKNNRIEGVKEFREKCYTRAMDLDEVLDFQEETGALILCPVKNEDWSCNAYNYRSKIRAEEDPDSRVIQVKDVEQKHKKNDDVLVKLFGSKKDIEIEEKTLKERESWLQTPEIRTKQSYMIRANFTTPEGISVCNGDIGEVVDVYPSGSVKFHLYRIDKEILIERREFTSEWCDGVGFLGLPIIPASAITIHKAQGATVSGIILDPRKLWHEEYLPHKLYTAFSRVRKMEDIKITFYILDSILDHPAIQEKLEFIWSIPYMKEYLTPETI
jgi:hypothetical protein